MSEALARFSEHPIVLFLVIFFIGGIAYGLLKKLMRLAMMFAMGCLVLAAWFLYTGEEPPPAMKRAAERAGRTIQQGAERGTEKAREVGERLGEELERAARERIDEALGGGRAKPRQD